MKCPKCKSKNVKPILWGMPTYDAYNSGKYYIGGCCIPIIGDHISDYGCLDCDFLWCKKDFRAEDIKKIFIKIQRSWGLLEDLETKYYRVYCDGRIIAYSTKGNSRKWQWKQEGKMSIKQFQKLARYLIEIILYKIPPEYEDEICDGDLLTVSIEFPDERKSTYSHFLQGTSVWNHIKESFKGSGIEII
jgi:hypothetical protein